MKKLIAKSMELIKINFLIFIIHVGILPNVYSQDSKGTDFWLMFPAQFSGTNTLTLFITSDVNTSGIISGSSFASIPFSVSANTVTPIILPMSLQDHSIDFIDNKGIHVVALKEVTVYGLNRQSYTTDAYLGLPTDALGTVYRVLTYQNVGVVNGTAFGIVGAVDNTLVTITASVTTASRIKGVPYNITLNQGETYYLQHSESSTGDLSGTLINSTQPIGVFGSHKCANITSDCLACDHIVEMLPPTPTYGKKFGAVPLSGRDSSGDQWKFLASENGTTIMINGVVQSPVLLAGEFFERNISTMSVIESDKPILAAQFAKGITCTGNTTGDPFMSVVPSFEQYLSNYTMTTVSGFTSHYINIVAPNNVVGKLTLDGIIIPIGSYKAIGTSNFSGAQIAVTEGSHTLMATSPFGATIYGWNIADSYGYGGGQSFSPVARVSSLNLSPSIGTNNINNNQCWQTVVKDQFNNPLQNIRVDYLVKGLNPQIGFSFTNASGIASFCYTGIKPGDDSINASVGTLSQRATFKWTNCGAGRLVAINPINLSLDSNCERIVKPFDLLFGAKITSCEMMYEVNLAYPSGTTKYVPSNKLDHSHIGYCMDYSVLEKSTGRRLVGKLCVMDSNPPQLGASVEYLTCFEFAQLPFGTYKVADNCNDSAKVTLVGGSYKDYGCGNPIYLGVATRKLLAKDSWGNSTTLTKTIYIRKISLDSINCVRDTASVFTNSSQKDSKGNPNPKYSGAPTVNINGKKVPLLPSNSNCKMEITYKDEIIPGSVNSYKILRQWNLHDLCTGKTKLCNQWIYVTDKPSRSMDPLEIREAISQIKLNINLFPVPNKGQFTLNIEHLDLSKETTLKIYSIMGQKIWDHKINSAQPIHVNLAENNAASGMYIIVLKNGDTVQQKKFIVQ